MKIGLLLLVVLRIALLALYNIYYWVASRVTVSNNTSVAITFVEVKLPRNTLTFSDVNTGEPVTIYRNIEQADGSYHYRISFSQDQEISGNCGYVTQNEYFTNFIIIVESLTKITCENKAL